jgi:abhydrolase domain-containing protein 12
MLSAGASDRIHVLAVDYRGYGLSTGFPTEEGVITDGIAMVKWALDVAKIPPERIALVGQSLGTAVAAAVAEHFSINEHIDFAGVLLAAGFTSIPGLMMTYSLTGFVPTLLPLRLSPGLQAYFSRHFIDTWNTVERVANWVRHGKTVNLRIVHATNDRHIPWTHSTELLATSSTA